MFKNDFLQFEVNSGQRTTTTAQQKEMNQFGAGPVKNQKGFKHMIKTDN
jgi:hypothetical protein